MTSAPPDALRAANTPDASRTYDLTGAGATPHLWDSRPLEGNQGRRLQFGSLGVLLFAWPELPAIVPALVILAAGLVGGFALGLADGLKSRELQDAATLAELRARHGRIRSMWHAALGAGWREWDDVTAELDAVDVLTSELGARK